MKKLFSLLAICFVSNMAKTQNLSFDIKLGYAVGEKKTSKHPMLYRSTGISYEKDIKYELAFTIGIAGATTEFSYTDTLNNNVYEKQYFLQLPVSIVKYYYLSKNSNFFLQFGPMFSVLPINKKEVFTIAGKQTQKTTDPGFNMGLLGNVGFKSKVAKNNWYVSVALSGYQDFFASNKNSAEKIKFNQFGLGISFIKGLDK
jgi:hypothetical protein